MLEEKKKKKGGMEGGSKFALKAIWKYSYMIVFLLTAA